MFTPDKNSRYWGTNMYLHSSHSVAMRLSDELNVPADLAFIISIGLWYQSIEYVHYSSLLCAQCTGGYLYFRSYILICLYLAQYWDVLQYFLCIYFHKFNHRYCFKVVQCFFPRDHFPSWSNPYFFINNDNSFMPNIWLFPGSNYPCPPPLKIW